MPDTLDARQPSPTHRAAVLVLLAIIVGTLYFARVIIIPLTLAAILALVLTPLVRILERGHLGRPVSVVVSLVVGLSLIASVGWLVIAQADDLIHGYPEYRSRITDRIHGAYAAVEDVFTSASKVAEEIADGNRKAPFQKDNAEQGKLAASPSPGAWDPAKVSDEKSAAEPEPEPTPEPVKVQVVKDGPEAYMPLANWVLGYFVNPIAAAAIAGGFLLFFLLYREDLLDRITRICGKANIHMTTVVIAEVGSRVRKYLLALLFVNSLIGAAVTIGLWFLGIPKPVVWGVMAATLRFVPFIGPLVAAIFPLAFSLAVTDGWVTPVLVAAWIILVDQLSENTLEPWLYGSQVGISPTAMLFAFVFWTWMWGPVGLMLAAPITICLVAFGRHVPQLETLHILFGNEPVLTPQARLYQRLLNGNRHEARNILRLAGREKSPAELYDEIVLPAMVQVKGDQLSQAIEVERAERAIELAARVLANYRREVGSDEAPRLGAEGEKGVAVLITGDEGIDRILADYLREHLRKVGYDVRYGGSRLLVNEVVETVHAGHVDVIVFATIEPVQLSRLRFLLKRLRQEVSSTPLWALVWRHPSAQADDEGVTEKYEPFVICNSLREAGRRFRPAMRGVETSQKDEDETDSLKALPAS